MITIQENHVKTRQELLTSFLVDDETVMMICNNNNSNKDNNIDNSDRKGDQVEEKE